MKRLTKAEEEIMQIIWTLGSCTVRQIRETIGGDPLPPHSTISTFVRILEEKGFVDHKAHGRTYEYFPIVSKENYSRFTVKRMLTDYFEGSAKGLVSFLVKEKDISYGELNDLLDRLDEDEE